MSLVPITLAKSCNGLDLQLSPGHFQHLPSLFLHAQTWFQEPILTMNGIRALSRNIRNKDRF